MNAIPGDMRSVRPFVRVLTTPPGLPWDQARAARLEAAHTSPVALRDVTLIVRRLKPWTFNTAGRFAAVYVRAQDSRDTFTVEVDGQDLRIDLPGSSARPGEGSALLLRSGLAVLIVAGMVGMGMTSFQKRQELETRLASAEARIARQARDIRRIKHSADTERVLHELELQDRTAGAALIALDRFSQARTPEARIDAFYWSQGQWAVEVRGDTAPANETLGLSRERQVRRGVWLWTTLPEGPQP